MIIQRFILTTDYIFIALILFAAAFTQGLSGFGFQLVALSLLAFIIDVKLAIPLCALYGLLINIYLTIVLRRHISVKSLKSLIFGSIIGIPVGIIFLKNADSGLIKFLLGFVLLIFVIVSVSKFRSFKKINEAWGYLFGMFSGMLGGAFNINGPPVLIYFYLRGTEKIDQKASFTGFFIFSSIFIVSSHFITGLTNAIVLNKFLVFLPVVLIGQFFGNAMFSKISTEIFNKIILVFLATTGLIMIFG